MVSVFVTCTQTCICLVYRWIKGLADKDLLVANTIPYLVSCAVSNVGTVSILNLFSSLAI